MGTVTKSEDIKPGKIALTAPVIIEQPQNSPSIKANSSAPFPPAIVRATWPNNPIPQRLEVRRQKLNQQFKNRSIRDH